MAFLVIFKVSFSVRQDGILSPILFTHIV